MPSLSPSEFAKLGGGNVSDLQFATSQTPQQVQQPQQPQQSQGLFSRIKESFGKRRENTQQALGADQSFQSKALQAVGQTAGFVGDVGADVVATAASKLPEPVKNVAKTAGLEVLSTPLGQTGLQAIQGGMEAWENFKEVNPEMAGNLEAVLNIGSLIPIGKGAQVAGKAGMELAEAGAKGAVRAGEGALDVARAGKGRAGEFFATIPKQLDNELAPAADNLTVDALQKRQGTIRQTFDKYVKAGEDYATDVRNKRPDAVLGERGTEALGEIQKKLKAAAEAKKAALGEVGEKVVGGMQQFQDDFARMLRDDIGLEFDKEAAKFVNAPGRISKISLDKADNRMLEGVSRLMRDLGDSPTVTQIDDAVDAIQDILYKRKQITQVPVNSQVEGLLKLVTGKLNSTVKNAAGEGYTLANKDYSKVVKTFQKLNDALGKEGERGASLMKKLFSPAGNESTRRLFDQIKELTGIDLFQESSFAKFAMEASGDTAQKSLLQTMLERPSGDVWTRVYDFVKDKVSDPVAKARRKIDEPVKKARKSELKKK